MGKLSIKALVITCAALSVGGVGASAAQAAPGTGMLTQRFNCRVWFNHDRTYRTISVESETLNGAETEAGLQADNDPQLRGGKVDCTGLGRR